MPQTWSVTLFNVIYTKIKIILEVSVDYVTDNKRSESLASSTPNVKLLTMFDFDFCNLMEDSTDNTSIK